MCGRRAAGIKAADRGASGVVRLQSQARHWVVKMGEEGRVYLSAAELSPVYPPKQVQLVLERIWFESGQLLRETTPSGTARVAARITRKNTARSQINRTSIGQRFRFCHSPAQDGGSRYFAVPTALLSRALRRLATLRWMIPRLAALSIAEMTRRISSAFGAGAERIGFCRLRRCALTLRF